MRLVVGVNHAAPFHVGGSEKVVEQITESMSNDYGMDCHVLAKYADGVVTRNGVKIQKTRDQESVFLRQLEDLKPDHFHVYSDSFVYWSSVVRNAEKIKADKSIALVGMNYMRSNPEIGRLFKTKKDQFKVIAHSENYLDYQTCDAMDIPVNVIPNAINLTEFCDQGISFRKKYGIKTENLILCVSNFFPGKGQEHLHFILRSLWDRRKDFTAVFVCSTVNFQPANVLRMRHSQVMSKAPYPNRVLVDISRSDTIQAFRESDLFAFPSQIEVAPLVILEAMSVGLPWVSLNVGNVPTLSGGTVVYGEKKSQGKWQYSVSMYKDFTDKLDILLSDNELRKQRGEEGKQQILAKYDWSQVRKQYYKIFTGEESP